MSVIHEVSRLNTHPLIVGLTALAARRLLGRDGAHNQGETENSDQSLGEHYYCR